MAFHTNVSLESELNEIALLPLMLHYLYLNNLLIDQLGTYYEEMKNTTQENQFKQDNLIYKYVFALMQM